MLISCGFLSTQISMHIIYHRLCWNAFVICQQNDKYQLQRMTLGWDK